MNTAFPAGTPPNPPVLPPQPEAPGAAPAAGSPGCWPPQPEAPGEDLLSLIFFYETNPDAVIESLPAPIGQASFPPVVAHEYLGAKLDAITVT